LSCAQVALKEKLERQRAASQKAKAARAAAAAGAAGNSGALDRFGGGGK
jgi:hypothetical protein